MKRFGYWRDPLFLTACILYALNRWLVQSRVQSPFLQGQLNDCLLIPCALPLILWVQHQLGVRARDDFPSGSEIGFHLVVWSVLCEIIGPHVMRVTGDVLDVVAYAGGGLIAWLWWRSRTVTALQSP